VVLEQPGIIVRQDRNGRDREGQRKPPVVAPGKGVAACY
jgi:hypothetical protein